jgi:hypothetical protein
LLPFVFVGFKVSQLNKKLQPVKHSNMPLRRLQFFDLHTETYLHEVKQKNEIIFAQPISIFCFTTSNTFVVQTKTNGGNFIVSGSFPAAPI